MVSDVKTLYIERSAGRGRDGGWTETLDLDGVGRIVVGTGPGSFAGVRGAIAFAQGFALGRACGVFGLPSPCAVAAQVFGRCGVRSLAVVGDARRGKLWIALFDGLAPARDIFQSGRDEVAGAVPADAAVVTVDGGRIGGFLAEAFGARYLGEELPTAEGLKAVAEANPALLAPDPLPIYLNPPVRAD